MLRAKTHPILLEKKQALAENQEPQAATGCNWWVCHLFWTVGSILVGAFDEGKLKYLGRVGSGFGKTEDEFLSLLSAIPRENSPFEPTLRLKMNVHWMEPHLTAEIEFQEWTPDLKLRQLVFIRLLEDPPQSCVLFPGNHRNKKSKGKQQ